MGQDVFRYVGSHSFELLRKAEEERNKRNSKRLKDLADLGQHPWQNKDYIERNRKRLRYLATQGKHPFQDKDFLARNLENRKKRAAEKNAELLAKGIHLFQTDNHPAKKTDL
jgi:hypothetical protein